MYQQSLIRHSPRYASLTFGFAATSARRPLQRDAARLEDVRAARVPQRRVGVLLDEQDGRARAWISSIASKIACTRIGARPSEGSSSSSSARPRHQRAADREHLLLAAGERAGASASAARRAAGTARSTRSRSARDCPRSRLRRYAPSSRFSCDREVREDAAPSGRATMPRAHDLGAAARLRDRLALEARSALRRAARGPMIARSVVVLPAPFAPISVTISPCADAAATTPFRAWIAPYVTDRSVTSQDLGREAAPPWPSSAPPR